MNRLTSMFPLVLSLVAFQAQAEKRDLSGWRGRKIEVIESNPTQKVVRVASRSPSKEKVVFIFQKGSEQESNTRFNFGVGVGGGFNYMLPLAHFQVALANQISLGVKPFLINATHGDTTQRAFGGFLTATYFINRAAFRGFFFEGGGGLYAIETVGSQETSRYTQPAGTLLFGWRGLTRYFVNLGFSGGLQYVGRAPESTPLDFKGFMPFFSLDVSYAF